MTQEDDKGSAAMLGSPGLAVWCCVKWAELSPDSDEDDFTGALWIRMAMPAILPVGSDIDLPTPRSWDSATGVMTGRIVSWSLCGDAIVCELEDTSHLGQDSVAELLAIGYADHSGGYPDEVWKAIEKMLR